MKLIENCNFSGNLSEVAHFLTESGILVSTTDDYATIPGKSYVARNIKIGIWVHLDNQYEDALALLENRQHVVKNPLTHTEMQSLKSEAKTYLSNAVEKAIKVLLICIVVLSLVFSIYYWLIKM